LIRPRSVGPVRLINGVREIKQTLIRTGLPIQRPKPTLLRQRRKLQRRSEIEKRRRTELLMILLLLSAWCRLHLIIPLRMSSTEPKRRRIEDVAVIVTTIPKPKPQCFVIRRNEAGEAPYLGENATALQRGVITVTEQLRLANVVVEKQRVFRQSV